MSGRRRFVIGYYNPTMMYPSPLVAVVSMDNRYALAFPDGSEIPIALPVRGDLGGWAAAHGVVLLQASSQVYLTRWEFLYAVSETEILIGAPSVMLRNLALRLALWTGPSIAALQIAEFLGTKTVIDRWLGAVEEEFHGDEERFRLWKSVSRMNSLSGTVLIESAFEIERPALEMTRSHISEDLRRIYAPPRHPRDVIALGETKSTVGAEHSDKRETADLLFSLGSVHKSHRDWELARRSFQDCLQLRRELGDSRGIAITLHELGLLYQDLEYWDDAQRFIQECLRHWQELGNRHGVAEALHQLGRINQAQGKWGAAAGLFEESLRIGQELSDRRVTTKTLRRLGEIRHQQGDTDEALRLYEQALRLEFGE